MNDEAFQNLKKALFSSPPQGIKHFDVNPTAVNSQLPECLLKLMIKQQSTGSSISQNAVLKARKTTLLKVEKYRD